MEGYWTNNIFYKKNVIIVIKCYVGNGLRKFFKEKKEEVSGKNGGLEGFEFPR